jgi:hypothetical protein
VRCKRSSSVLPARLFADRGREFRATRPAVSGALLAVCVAMWWVIHLAASCIHHGQRDRFDRQDRRDKSLLRLGRLWLLDILRRTSASAFLAATLTCCLPFRKTASGWRFSLRF